MHHSFISTKISEEIKCKVILEIKQQRQSCCFFVDDSKIVIHVLYFFILSVSWPFLVSSLHDLLHKCRKKMTNKQIEEQQKKEERARERERADVCLIR